MVCADLFFVHSEILIWLVLLDIATKANQEWTATSDYDIILMFLSNHRKGRSAPRPRKPQSPSACLMESVWVCASTGPTTAVCVQMNGAARQDAHAPYLWPSLARTASVSRGQPCSFSHVNAVMTAATSMKWPFLHSTGCTETHTSSLTSTDGLL